MDTSAAATPSPDQPDPAQRKSRWPQILAIVVGGIAALIGLGLALGGGGILAAFGSDGTLNSGSHSLSTKTTALVSSVANIDGAGEIADVVGDPELRLTVTARRAGDGVFIGIGRAADVDRYFAGAGIEEVSDIDVDPFELTGKRIRPGSRQPAPPASRRFWVAQGSGRGEATMRWKLADGDYRLVVMNADASRGVLVDGSVGVKVPHLPTIGWVMLGIGVLLIVGGGLAIVLAGVSLARRP